MLNYEEIKKAIDNKEIEVSVSFGMKDGMPSLYEKEHSLLDDNLIENLYSDRLKLTMGPIIKVLNKKTIPKKYRFKTEKDLYDLRKSEHKYIIKPGESVIILTNERVRLNGRYACLVVPRISLSDVGIVATTAYVDPFYNGLMRLHVSNLSDKSYELHTLEAIAQCFFFEFADPVSEVFEEQFSTKSVFFGQTWQGIINSDRNPFPTKKTFADKEKFSVLIYQWNIIWEFVKMHSLIFGFFANVVVLLCGYATFKQNFAKYTSVVEQVETSFEPISSEITINSGEYYGEKEIKVDLDKSSIVTVLCNNDDVHYRVISGNTPDEATIIFSYALETPANGKYELNFTYAIIRRINK